MRILYGSLENYGIQVYIDENNNLFIEDNQIIVQHDNTQENIMKLIEEAKQMIDIWKKECK